MPEPTPDDLFGDFIGETLPALLLNTCGGDLEGIKQLVLNRNASSYCRWSACSALGYAVALGMAERDEIVQFLKTLLTGDEAEPAEMFWEGVVDTLIDLHPGDSLSEIRAAYDSELVDESFAEIEYIERKAALDKEQTLDELRREAESRIPDNVHDYMRWWYEPGKHRGSDRDNVALQADRGERKRKKKRRKGNKTAKKARRKNR